MNPTILPLTLRHDLRWQPTQVKSESRWNLFDPVSSRSYQLRDAERFILNQLDGHVTLRDIQRRFENRFLPQTLPLDELHGFLQVAQREGLLVSQTMGQGITLNRRRENLERAKNWQRLTQILAIRLPGIAPQRFLEPLHERLRSFIRPWAFVIGLLLILSAIGLVITNLSEIRQRWPSWQEVMTLNSAAWVLIAIGISKGLHELAHGILSTHFGAQCRELGLMFLVFSPSLYCDVSESATLPDKRQRMLISAAGVFVELLLGSACVWLWWFSEPGPLRQAFLWMAVVCTLNTLLINGNPLLRFDGYYVLSDWWEIPNLQQTARAYLASLWQPFFSRATSRRPVLLSRQGGLGLATYGLLAVIYRWLLLAAILWSVASGLKALGLSAVGRGIVAMVLVSAVGVPTVMTLQRWMQPGQLNRLRWGRVGVASIGLMLLVGALLYVPVAQRVTVPVYFEPLGATGTYVSVPGIVVAARREGDQVDINDWIIRLENPQLKADVLRLQMQRDAQQLHVDHLRRAQTVEPSAVDQLPAAEAALQDLAEQLARRQQDQASLTIRAPISGTIIPPFQKRKPADELTLPNWQGTPLDQANQQAYLEAGTLVCWVGDATRHAAVAMIEQGDVGQVNPGQLVKLRCDQLPTVALHGKVVEVSKIETSVAASEIPFSATEVGSTPSEDADTSQKYFQARIELINDDPTIRAGALGHAKITVAEASWGSRILRWFRRQFGIV